MAKQQSSSGDILHVGSVRLRTTGSGDLELLLRSLQNVNYNQLADYVLSNPSDREKVILSNFINQRGQLEFRTTLIDEWFIVSKVVIFVKTIWTGYPQ